MKTVFALFVLVMLSAACSAGSSELQAPEIAYNSDVCDECSMIISDAKFATATIDLKGNAHKFDDIGGMLIYHLDHPESQVRAYFVHDYNTQTWLRGETALYVRSPEIDSPMNDGIAAFADRPSAETFAARVQGTVYAFNELRVNVHLTLHNAP